MSSHLHADNIAAGYGSRTILDDLSLVLPSDRVTTIIGPNGCGRSTLLRTLSRLMTPTAGRVLLDGQPVEDMSRRKLARRLAVLPQNPVAPEGMTVADLAARGRQPHQPWYRQWSGDDEAIAAEAMEATGVADLADRIVMVLHDLSLAARFSDHVVVMKDGGVHCEGSPADILTPALLDDVFGLRAHVFADPVDGLPTIVPASHA